MMRILLGSLFAICFLATSANCARADSVNLGTLSFDPFFPGLIDAFTVNNSTGAFSVPGFPVIDNVVFTGATLAYTGSVPANQALGDLGPSGSQTFVLDSDTFSSATFQAVLSATLFTLADGTHFQADSNTVTTTLSPSNGANLIPGVDFAPIAISGSFVTAQVPEPPTWLLLVGMAPFLILLRRMIFRQA